MLKLWTVSTDGCHWRIAIACHFGRKKDRGNFLLQDCKDGGSFWMHLAAWLVFKKQPNSKMDENFHCGSAEIHILGHNDFRYKYMKKTSERRDLTEKDLMRRKKRCRKLMRDYSLN